MFYNPELECPKCKVITDEHDFVNKNCDCRFRLRIHFDYEALKEVISKKFLRKRPFNHDRYFEFYPLKDPSENLISLGVGGTPLVKSNKLADRLGVKSLFLKVETGNPSGSFKDRPISIGVSKAKEYGAKTVTAASSGNAAAALATFGARGAMDVIVFVPEHAPQGKLTQLAFLGAKIVRVSIEKEGEDSSVTLFEKAYKKYGWTPSPSFGPYNPFQFEGTKSLAFELCEQFNWEVPDWILCNTGSGGLLSGSFKGFKEFLTLDFIDHIPRMIAVQPEECAPIVEAARNRTSPFEFHDWPRTPNTAAGGLADPHPFDGDAALEAIYNSNGSGVAVSEKEILETQKWLATDEGIFGEPSGTAAIAGLIQLINNGTIDTNDIIVIPITGAGYKDLGIITNSLKIPAAIKPRIKELAALLD
ncbi:MAG: threonine synthase [Candidatus Hodarchaeota archaeon]